MDPLAHQCIAELVRIIAACEGNHFACLQEINNSLFLGEKFLKYRAQCTEPLAEIIEELS